MWVLDIALSSALDTFGNVIVWAFLSIFLIVFINRISNNSLVKTLNRYKRLHPVIGALLGAIPGCGGTILAAALFFRRQLSFGGLIATLIATVGEVIFVIVFRLPLLFLILLAFSVFWGIAIGYFFEIPKIKNFIDEKLVTKEKIQIIEKTKLSKGKNDFLRISFNVFIIYFSISILILLPSASAISFMNDEMRPAWAKHIFFQWYSLVLIIISLVYLLVRVGVKKSFGHHHAIIQGRVNNIKHLKTSVHEATEESINILNWLFASFFIINVLVEVYEDRFIRVVQNIISSYWLIIIALVAGLIPGCGTSIIFAVTTLTQANAGNITNVLISLMALTFTQTGDVDFMFFKNQKKLFVSMKLFLLLVGIIVGSILFIIK